MQSFVAYSGPLPPSSELEKYEKVHHGAADRIITMAENAQAMQRYALEGEMDITRRRMTASTMVSLCMIAAAVVAILFDPAWLSIPLGTVGILTFSLRELFRRIKI